jgi:hypothetical protein
MISKRTEQLLNLPLILGKYIFSIYYYDRRKDRHVMGKLIPRINFWTALYANFFARFILIGVVIESFWAGHANKIADFIVGLSLLPLLGISLAFNHTFITNYKTGFYLINEAMSTHKKMGKLSKLRITIPESFY